MKKRLAPVIAAALFVFFTGCTQGADSSGTPDSASADVIKIGVFEPQTGENAGGGLMEIQGIEAAHSARGEVLGKKIELVYADNKSNERDAVTAAEELVSRGVSGVIGSFGSDVSIAAGPVFKAAGVTVVGTSCTDPLVTEDNNYYFRMCWADEVKGTALAAYAKQNGCKRAAVICDISDSYGIGLKTSFVEAFGSENIVAEAYFSEGDEDFGAQIESVMTALPDAVFVPCGYVEAGLMIKQAHLAGYKDVLFLGDETWENEEMIEIAGEAAEACRFITFFSAGAEHSEASAGFLEDFAAINDGALPQGAVTALGYDAYMAALDAIEAAGSAEREAVRAAMSGLEGEGASGHFSFDENGDAIKKQAVIMTVADGKFTCAGIVALDEVSG